MWPRFRLLQNLAYELKIKNPDMKRNVLFDDVASDLKMDVCFGSEEWKTIVPEEARRTLTKCRPAKASGRRRMTGSELEELLSNDDRNVDMQDKHKF